MKRIAAILVFFALMFQAKCEIPEWVKVIGLYTASITLDAVGDGLYDSGEKTWGHALQATSTGLLLISPALLDMNRDNWGWYLASYVSLRIAIFDYTYNATRGLPLSYTGNTALTDRIMREFNPPTGHVFFPKAIFFTVGIVIPIKEL